MLMIDSEGISISFEITSFLPDLKCFSTCCSLCGGCLQTRETSESFTFLSKPTVTFFFQTGQANEVFTIFEGTNSVQVRIVLDLKSNLEAVGKRLPYLAKYKASLDKDNKLAGVNIKIFCDSGSNYNESTADIAVGFAKSVYARYVLA